MGAASSKKPLMASAANGLEGMPSIWFKELIQGCLKPWERMQLFEVSKGLAAAVVEHIKLVMYSSDTRHRTSGELAAKQQAMKTLMAPLHKDATLHVHLATWSHTWEALPLDQVTCLTMRGMAITGYSLKALQLTRCSRLQTLRIKDGARYVAPEGSYKNPEGLTTLRASLFPPSLVELHLDKRFYGGHALGELLGLQITSITGANGPASTFTHLTHFHATDEQLTDAILDAILTASTLTHLTVAGAPALDKDRKLQEFKWQQLRLKRGADMSTLMLLPVWSIENLIIDEELRCGRCDRVCLEACLSHLAKCPSFQCEPDDWPVLEPVSPVFWLQGQLGPGLISMCARSLTRPGCLFLDGVPPTTSLLVASLPLLQSCTNVTGLGFRATSQDTWLPDDELAEHWQQVLAVVPAHIKHIALEAPMAPFVCSRHASVLVPLVMSSGQHSDVQMVLVMLRGICRPPEMRSLAEEYPERVRIAPQRVYLKMHTSSLASLPNKLHSRFKGLTTCYIVTVTLCQTFSHKEG